MSLNPLSGGASTTAKVGDVNAVIAALNAELDAIRARQMDVEKTLGMGLNAAVVRIETLENSPVVSDLGTLVAGMGARLDQAQAAIATLESEPDPAIPPDLSERVAALEALVVRAPAQDPSPILLPDVLPRPADVSPNEITLVYDKATLYYHDIAMYALRIDANKWRLVATLNYVVISPAVWTYDEIVEGTPDEVYAHAYRRLEELAELKPQHDAVHERVARMSEGAS